MKILYLSELHKTTPTNFLYQVRLTYWLPLQLLWPGLYLKVKGIQIGSPPAKGRRGAGNCSFKNNTGFTFTNIWKQKRIWASSFFVLSSVNKKTVNFAPFPQTTKKIHLFWSICKNFIQRNDGAKWRNDLTEHRLTYQVAFQWEEDRLKKGMWTFYQEERRQLCS